MSDQWALDPSTGDYILDARGKPTQTESLTNPAYIRLKAPRQETFVPGQKRRGWMYAPDATWGSEFYKQKKRNTTQDPSSIETLAESALQPLVDDGRATEVAINTVAAARHGLALQIDVSDGQGRPERLEFTPIG